jgi:hypothetical protein
MFDGKATLVAYKKSSSSKATVELCGSINFDADEGIAEVAGQRAHLKWWLSYRRCQFWL